MIPFKLCKAVKPSALIKAATDEVSHELSCDALLPYNLIALPVLQWLSAKLTAPLHAGAFQLAEVDLAALLPEEALAPFADELQGRGRRRERRMQVCACAALSQPIQTLRHPGMLQHNL